MVVALWGIIEAARKLNKEKGGQDMLFEEALPFIKEFVEELNCALEEYKPGEGLSQRTPAKGGGLVSIIASKAINFSEFEVRSAASQKAAPHASLPVTL